MRSQFGPLASGVGISGAACCLLLAGTALAHEFHVPEHVQADGAGHFEYEATIILTSAVAFGADEIDGRDNTTLGWTIGDGFCVAEREPGTWKRTLRGYLVDVTQNGSVRYLEAYCDGWSGEGTTVILAPPVDNEARSWGAVKALYETQ